MCNVHDLSLNMTITMHLFNFFLLRYCDRKAKGDREATERQPCHSIQWSTWLGGREKISVDWWVVSLRWNFPYWMKLFKRFQCAQNRNLTDQSKIWLKTASLLLSSLVVKIWFDAFEVSYWVSTFEGPHEKRIE